MKKHVVCIAMLVAMLNLTSCGYFLYPDRVGQSSGKLDSTVIILDALGLLVGVLPGRSGVCSGSYHWSNLPVAGPEICH